jgi:hypothetical protein
MSFAKNYPDFATIEGHVRRARAERSLAIAQLIANGLAAVGRVFQRAGHAEADRKHVAGDAFLRRSIQ